MQFAGNHSNHNKKREPCDSRFFQTTLIISCRLSLLQSRHLPRHRLSWQKTVRLVRFRLLGLRLALGRKPFHPVFGWLRPVLRLWHRWRFCRRLSRLLRLLSVRLRFFLSRLRRVSRRSPPKIFSRSESGLRLGCGKRPIQSVFYLLQHWLRHLSPCVRFLLRSNLKNLGW